MKENKNKYIIGTRYFDKNKNVIKMIKVKNENTFSMMNSDKERITITKDKLYEDYTRLTPAGYLQLAIIELNGIKDVSVALYRTNKVGIEAEYTLPYCICRQNIVNIFYELAMGGVKIKHLGMSISLDSCPSNIDYREMLACDKIIHQEIIAVYIDDDFEDILRLFKHYKYDNILRENRHNKESNPLLTGYQKSLNLLLKEENFSYDFYRAFGINEIDAPLKYHKEIFDDTEILVLDREQEIVFEKEYGIKIIQSFVFKFDYSMILKDIQMEHFLIYSKEDKQLYVILYAIGVGLSPIEKEQIINMKNQIAYFNSII